VRGKVLSFRLNEPEFSEEERRSAATRAGNFFDLARRYATRLRKPTIITVGGLSGAGKTALARAIAGELGLRVISADAVRQSLFGAAKKQSEYGKGAYTAEASRLTYQTMIERGRELLGEDQGVILDATFLRDEDRSAAQEMAMAAGAEWRLIECRLALELVRTRLEERVAKEEGVSDATWEIYLKQREERGFICDESDSRCLALDTSGGLPAYSKTAADWLRQLEFDPR
jgi:predicted kinase